TVLPGWVFLRAAGPVRDAEDFQRRHGRGVLEEPAIGLGRHREQRADAVAVHEHVVAKHVRRIGYGLGDDLVLAHHEAFPFQHGYAHDPVYTTWQPPNRPRETLLSARPRAVVRARRKHIHAASRRANAASIRSRAKRMR